MSQQSEGIDNDVWNYNSGNFLFNSDRFSSNVHCIEYNFSKEYADFQLAYSIKANSHPAVLKSVIESGIWLEISSHFEWIKAFENGCDMDKVIVNTPYYTSQFLDILKGTKAIINIDSIGQLKSVLQHSDLAEMGIRFNVCEPTDEPSRFGIPNTQANLDLISQLLLAHNVNLKSINCHIWTGHRSAESYAKRTVALMKIYEKLSKNFDIHYINIGGGFAGNMPTELAKQFSGIIPSWEDYAKAICRVVNQSLFTNNPVLLIEPGAGLVADCAYFLTEVMDIRNINGVHYAVVNASNNWLRPTGHKKELVFQHIRSGIGQEYSQCKIVGLTCMENDIIAICPNSLKVGDKLLFENMGAYTLSFASDFILGSPTMLEMKKVASI